MANYLEREFEECIDDIEYCLPRLSRIEQLRANKWLYKLKEPQKFLSWKRNRNLMAKILKEMICFKGELEPPFNHFPAEDSQGLPTLPSWMKIYVNNHRNIDKIEDTQSEVSPQQTKDFNSLQEYCTSIRKELALERLKNNHLQEMLYDVVHTDRNQDSKMDTESKEAFCQTDLEDEDLKNWLKEFERESQNIFEHWISAMNKI
eukprot:gb/GECH01009908.1/.p1 GENE.gb/GECH01009908.1/~~gb/GECH01009908.1/.p1  ORF type:complete len:204 (+),score=30.22 gb/GECH01009908.1/:1-612(+)